MVKFLNFKNREGIHTMAREKRSMKMRGTGIYINEDFSDLVRQRRREQLPKLKEERQKGNIAYFRYELIVHPPRERRERVNPNFMGNDMSLPLNHQPTVSTSTPKSVTEKNSSKYGNM